jgi:hypothetical protein
MTADIKELVERLRRMAEHRVAVPKTTMVKARGRFADPTVDDPVEGQAANALEALAVERDEERQIVDRVWKALGIETFEQAGGREISEIVAAQRHALEAQAREIPRPDWESIYEDCAHKPDRDQELVSVTRETLRLALHAMTARQRDDAYHNVAAGVREINAALNAPHIATVHELANELAGMVGLVTLLLARDDITPALREVLNENHRVVSARTLLSRNTERKQP